MMRRNSQLLPMGWPNHEAGWTGWFSPKLDVSVSWDARWVPYIGIPCHPQTSGTLSKVSTTAPGRLQRRDVSVVMENINVCVNKWVGDKGDVLRCVGGSGQKCRGKLFFARAALKWKVRRAQTHQIYIAVSKSNKACVWFRAGGVSHERTEITNHWEHDCVLMQLQFISKGRGEEFLYELCPKFRMQLGKDSQTVGPCYRWWE